MKKEIKEIAIQEDCSIPEAERIYKDRKRIEIGKTNSDTKT